MSQPSSYQAVMDAKRDAATMVKRIAHLKRRIEALEGDRDFYELKLSTQQTPEDTERFTGALAKLRRDLTPIREELPQQERGLLALQRETLAKYPF